MEENDDESLFRMLQDPGPKNEKADLCLNILKYFVHRDYCKNSKNLNGTSNINQVVNGNEKQIFETESYGEFKGIDHNRMDGEGITDQDR